MFTSLSLCRIFIIAHQRVISSSIITHGNKSTFAFTQPIQSSAISCWNRLQSQVSIDCQRQQLPMPWMPKRPFCGGSHIYSWQNLPDGRIRISNPWRRTMSVTLSYDNGGTFKVIKCMVGGCPLTQQYDFTIHSFAPTGNALFAWTWFNEIGNREMYMNCAFVQIVGSSTTRRSRAKRQSAFTSMSSLPNIWRANIAGLDQCATVESLDPVFPNLGSDVVYGGVSSSSSPKDTQQGCDSSSPSSQTFQGSSNAGTLPQSSSAQTLATATTSTSISSSIPTSRPTAVTTHVGTDTSIS